MSVSVYFPSDQQMNQPLNLTIGVNSSVSLAFKNLFFLFLLCVMCRQMSDRRRHGQRRNRGCLDWLCDCCLRLRDNRQGRPVQWLYLCRLIKRTLTEKRRKREQKRLLDYIIEVKEFRVHQGAEYEQDRCTICLEGFIDKQEVCSLVCRHIFHKKCIANWLKEKQRPNMNCPVCNKNILPTDAIPGMGNPQDLEQDFLRQRLEEVERSDLQVHGGSANVTIEMTSDSAV